MIKNTVIQKSIKWSGMAEIGNKMLLPISTMLLARILTPEDFGVVAICNMLISFADIISDAGFGKYIVQTDFKNDKDADMHANVAFWSHFLLAIIIWATVFLLRYTIARVLGNEDYADVISIASLQLIAMSVSSIPLALLRRKFEFKKTFYVRIVAALVPLLITIPMALILKSYWALIMGNMIGTSISAVFLLYLSKWHPKLCYSFHILRKMFSFSLWSLCEGLAHWTIFWFDTLLVSHYFSSYYLGLYKNSTHMMISLFGVITATMSPVLLSVLSRMKKNAEKSFEMVVNIEKLTLYILLPIGVIIFFYRYLATTCMFGEKWLEASDIIGAWALMMVVSIVFYTFPAEVFKSKGIPKYLFYYQMSYLILLVPSCCLAISFDFWAFVYTRTLGILLQVSIFLLYFYKFIQWNRCRFIKSMGNPLLATLILIMFCWVTHVDGGSVVWEFILLFITMIMYVLILFLFKNDIKKSVEFIRNGDLDNTPPQL